MFKIHTDNLFAESHPSCRVIRIAGKSLTTSLIAPQALHDSRNFATVFGMLITSLRRSTRLSRICGLTNVAALSRQIQPQLFVLPRRKLLPRITTVCALQAQRQSQNASRPLTDSGRFTLDTTVNLRKTCPVRLRAPKPP